jgi:hypothetical protein
MEDFTLYSKLYFARSKMKGIVKQAQEWQA